MNAPRTTVRRALEDGEHPLDRLDRAELKVLQELSVDASNSEIAKQLSLTEHAVQNLVSRIMDKLELLHRRDAVRYARRSGLRAN